MRRTDGHKNTGLANLKPPKPMSDGHKVNRKFLVDLCGDFADFCQRHGLVRFVVEIKRPPSVRMVAHAAIERDDRTIFSGAYMPDQGGLIDWIAHEKKQIGL